MRLRTSAVTRTVYALLGALTLAVSIWFAVGLQYEVWLVGLFAATAVYFVLCPWFVEIRADDSGVVVRMFLSRRLHPWENISGFEAIDGYPRLGVFLLRSNGGRIKLPPELWWGRDSKANRSQIAGLLEGRRLGRAAAGAVPVSGPLTTWRFALAWLSFGPGWLLGVLLMWALFVLLSMMAGAPAGVVLTVVGPLAVAFTLFVAVLRYRSRDALARGWAQIKRHRGTYR